MKNFLKRLSQGLKDFSTLPTPELPKVGTHCHAPRGLKLAKRKSGGFDALGTGSDIWKQDWCKVVAVSADTVVIRAHAGLEHHFQHGKVIAVPAAQFWQLLKLEIVL